METGETTEIVGTESGALKVVDVYTSQPELDKALTGYYKYCSVGMVFDEDWTYPLRYADGPYDVTLENFNKPVSKPLPEFKPETIDPSLQMNILSMCEMRINV